MNARLAVAVMACCTTLPLATRAAEPGAQPKHACARLRDRNERLDCYDAAFGKPADEVSTPAASAAPANTESNFGLTAGQINRNAPGGMAPVPDRVNSAVVALKRGANGRFTVTLENGQVWVQIESEPSAMMAIGDSVTIRDAAMGSYLLRTPGGVGTRVRRLE